MLPSTGVTEHSSRQAVASWDALILVVVTIILGVAFITADFDWHISTYPAYTLSADKAEAQIAAGNPARRLAYIAVGLTGLALLVYGRTNRRNYFKLPLILLGIYFLICLASIIWSDDPGLTLRRLPILVFCLLGIVGMIQAFSGHELIHVALFIALFMVATGFAAEMANATFHPLASDYRFAGTLHPNTQGSICAILAIAAFSCLKQDRRGKLFYWVAVLVGLFFLLLTKSRTSLIGCILAIYIASLLGGTPELRKILSVGLPFLVCLGVVFMLLSGLDAGSVFDQVLHLGRSAEGSELSSFSGRAPLWAKLMEDIMERPLLGYGYNAFWTPDRIFAISSAFDWTIPNAHNVAIDVILHAGLLGGACYILGYLLATLQVGRRCLATSTPAAFFAMAMAVFAIISFCFESGFSEPKNFETFFALVAIFAILVQPEST